MRRSRSAAGPDTPPRRSSSPCPAGQIIAALRGRATYQADQDTIYPYHPSPAIRLALVPDLFQDSNKGGRMPLGGRQYVATGVLKGTLDVLGVLHAGSARGWWVQAPLKVLALLYGALEPSRPRYRL